MEQNKTKSYHHQKLIPGCKLKIEQDSYTILFRSQATEESLASEVLPGTGPQPSQPYPPNNPTLNIAGKTKEK